MERRLIVNADDFGLSVGVNQGIMRAHREGILTSASLMVRFQAARHAAENAGDLALGLHLDLSEWIYRDGQWVMVYQRVEPDDVEAVRRETREQLALFEQLTGRTPSHLDSHQHVHEQEPLRSIARQVADELGVPLRSFSKRVRYCGNFYGQSGKGAAYADAISVAALIGLVATLNPGVTELACHPGEDPELDSAYRLERQIEVATLCDPRVRQALEKEVVQLISFEDLRDLPMPPLRSGQQLHHYSGGRGAREV
jgi:chitin disaccharide deacetylase